MFSLKYLKRLSSMQTIGNQEEILVLNNFVLNFLLLRLYWRNLELPLL